jgi:hypothetical protein
MTLLFIVRLVMIMHCILICASELACHTDILSVCILLISVLHYAILVHFTFFNFLFGGPKRFQSYLIRNV